LAMSFTLLLIASPAAQAATYYVSTNGNNSNAGTETAPFKTIQHAADVAKAGDTVIVMPGTYLETGAGNNRLGGIVSKNDGTASARIRFVSKERWGAKVTTRASGGPAEAIWRSMGDYVDIEGFEIDGTDAMASPGIMVHGAYSRVLYNHVHHISVARCGGGVGINSTGYDTNIGTEMIGNLIHDARRPHVNSCPGSSPVVGYGIYFATPHGKVQNNIIYNNGSVGIHLWHAPTETVVSHNLVFNNGRTGIVFGCGDKPFIQCNRITVSNNIFMNHEIFAIREYGNNSPTNKVMNNIIYGAGKIEMKNGTESGNLMGVNPNIPGLSSGDYRLGSGSPAIDAGTVTCASGSSCVPSEDFYQGKRPFGAAFDIGPQEFGSTPGSAPPLIPPSDGIVPPGGPGGMLIGPNGEVCYSGF
jgi:hypothetical protein